MKGKPRIIGIGYARTQLDTIHPQAHDIAMQAIVTEKGVMDGKSARK